MVKRRRDAIGDFWAGQQRARHTWSSLASDQAARAPLCTRAQRVALSKRVSLRGGGRQHGPRASEVTLARILGSGAREPYRYPYPNRYRYPYPYPYP